MQKQVREVAVYICEVCNTEYASKSSALACEKKPVEKKKFRVEDRISNVEPRMCGRNAYVFKGRVTRISGPFPPNEEYENKWLSSAINHMERINSHVFLYEVEFICPVCRMKKTARYYAPELKLVSR